MEEEERLLDKARKTPVDAPGFALNSEVPAPEAATSLQPIGVIHAPPPESDYVAQPPPPNEL